MKQYREYQYMPNTEMTERDKKEVNSKFWNGGKWDNFVAPFLTEKGEEMSLVDMGCNSGLFLKFAEDLGFKAIGVDSNDEAVVRGLKWRDDYGYHYDIIKKDLNNCIKDLPIVDYTVMANSHYYMTVNDFLDYTDVLQLKTRYVIIVTDEKHHLNRCWASADITDIRSVFKNWDEVGFIDIKPNDGDPGYRKLSSICFKSRFIEKVPVERIDASNHVQDDFWREIDNGKHFTETRYYRILAKYRKNWEPGRLDKWMQERVDNYESIKKDGLRTPIIIDKDDKILDGNHRFSGLINLGFKNVFVRKI